MTTTAPVSQRATPRLVDIEAQQETDESRVEKKERNFWTRVFQGIGIACICFNFAGVGVSYSGTVLVAALFALVASAAVIYYQMELQDTDSTFIVNENVILNTDDRIKTYHSYSFFCSIASSSKRIAPFRQ